MKDRQFLGITPHDWRIIGISLSILSLGLSIAWIGLIYFTGKDHQNNSPTPTPTSTQK